MFVQKFDLHSYVNELEYSVPLDFDTSFIGVSWNQNIRNFKASKRLCYLGFVEE